MDSSAEQDQYSLTLEVDDLAGLVPSSTTMVVDDLVGLESSSMMPVVDDLAGQESSSKILVVGDLAGQDPSSTNSYFGSATVAWRSHFEEYQTETVTHFEDS